MSYLEAETEDLIVEFRSEGPSDGPVVLLLHGWPDDATTWDGISPILNAAGFRTIAPMLRGFGGSRFRSPDTRRAGDACILAMDAIQLLDALGVDQFSVAGHDWGSNVTEALAVGWQSRVNRVAMLSTPLRLGGWPASSFEQAQRQWYHWFQATKRGEAAVRADPHGFARTMWVNWSPKGWLHDATFERVARSFENPDWVEVVLHFYRSRWDEVEPDPRSKWLDTAIREAKQIAAPGLFLQGEVDGINPPETTLYLASKFSGPFKRVTLPGVGHFPTREAPEAVARYLLEHFRSQKDGSEE